MLDVVPRQTNDQGPTDPLSLRVPKELLARLKTLAQREDRTLNAQVVRMLREAIQREDSPDADA
jgi:hypothetical protein